MAKITHSLFLLLLSSLPSTLSRCYYPNTKEAVDDFPCDPAAENGPCCAGGSGAMCLSNKSCKGPVQNMIRGSCTDQSWGIDCPLYCYLTPNIGPDIISCGDVTGRDTSFCCDGTVNCCNTGVGRFELLPSNPEAWATWDNTKSKFIVVKALSPSTTVSTSTIASTASTPVPTSATTTAPPPAQSGSGQTQSESSGLSTAVQAGVGVGVSVSAILLGVIAYLLWKLYQNKKGVEGRGGNPNTPEHQGQDGNTQYPTQLYSEQISRPEMYAYPGELSAERRVMELGGLPKHQEPAELPGGVIWPSRTSR